MRAGCLVLGLGNELFSDEGVGVAAARRIAAMDLPDVEVVDGGTLGLSLLPTVEGRRALLVIDALLDPERAPGDVVVIASEELRREARLLYSAHQLGVNEVLAAADLVGTTPEKVAAVGMVPSTVETGYGLSPLAQNRLPAMIESVMGVLASWEILEGAHA
ncbi:MAG: hydrogenase maturation protease [Acidimicrobiia bacterium]